MSLMNGLAGLGRNLSAMPMADFLEAEPETPERAPQSEARAPAPSILNNAPAPAPRTPSDANPYGDNPHAAALWAAEHAIMKPESGGKADAQNPVSSAGGLFQIINPTWDAAIQKLGLPVAASDAERNAQKYQPELNTRVMRLINTEAADTLESRDLPVTVQTLQAAHRLGPTGAVMAIKAAMADPNAPLVGNGLSPEAVRGNGDVARMTVGEFLARPYAERSI